MSVTVLRTIVRVTVFSLVLVAHITYTREIPEKTSADKGKNETEKASTKDTKIAAESYVYTKTSDGSDPYDHFGHSHFHHFGSGFHFPHFNYPTKYAVGTYSKGLLKFRFFFFSKIFQ